jgi:DNA primase
MFPIANDSGKIVAFGGRALGDDLPKYLNSPETPIYSKSNVLYHLDRAKEALRQRDFAVLVEGYMDAIAVARAGISNVVASCGTSLTEPQVKLLNRFTRRIIVNYDPDTAGRPPPSARLQSCSSRAPKCASSPCPAARTRTASSAPKAPRPTRNC